ERAAADGAAGLQPVFRWFVGLSLDEAVGDATVFTKNRERWLAGDVARGLLEQVVAEARARHLLSSEHFSVDGTLLGAWGRLKSSQRKDAPAGRPPADPRKPTIDFHGERRSNDTPASTPDRRRGSFAKATATSRRSGTTATSCWRTGLGGPSTAWSRRPP